MKFHGKDQFLDNNANVLLKPNTVHARLTLYLCAYGSGRGKEGGGRGGLDTAARLRGIDGEVYRAKNET